MQAKPNVDFINYSNEFQIFDSIELGYIGNDCN